MTILGIIVFINSFCTRCFSWAAGLGIFPGCAAAPGLGWAAGQFLPPEGDLHPRQAGAGECRKYRKN